MHVEEEYDPSGYSDEDLKDVFWAVDRDKYPVVYKKICTELDKREIQYEDLPQWERKQRNLDADLELAAIFLGGFWNTEC